jgi:hypothetical protein
MVVKSTKLPSALDARIRRAAAAAVNRSSSALMRDAIVRGQKHPKLSTRTSHLPDSSAPAKPRETVLRTKTTSVITDANARAEMSFRVALCDRHAHRVEFPACGIPAPCTIFEKPAYA